MIPKRNAFPMPGNGAKVAAAPASAPTTVLEEAAAPLTPAVDAPATSDEAVGTATLDATNIPPAPPRPKTSGRPGAPIQFSAAVVERMIRDLEQCLSPTVTFSEDVNAMRAEAHKKRESGLRTVLAALKAPA